MSHPDPKHDTENELPDDYPTAEQENDAITKGREHDDMEAEALSIDSEQHNNYAEITG